ncbi:MAG: DUF2080 family transposase-associated protein [Candidatus Nitrosopolaris sp.]
MYAQSSIMKYVEISRITTDVKKYGNSAHVILPKSWIGIEVVITPAERMEHEDKFIDKVAKEVGDNLTKSRPKSRKL